MERPSWDEYFMEIAGLVARRFTCLRRQVGAVVVQEKQEAEVELERMGESAGKPGKSQQI